MNEDLRARLVTETYGLPPQAAHLIGKLRAMPPELRALLLTAAEATK